MLSEISKDSVQKLKAEIKAKLAEIGAYADNELPEYILVMVINEKTKYQLKDDLSLFLGKNTDEFVDWLHKRINSNLIAGENIRKKEEDNGKDKINSQRNKERDEKHSRALSSSQEKKESSKINADNSLKSSQENESQGDGFVLKLRTESHEMDEFLQEPDEITSNVIDSNSLALKDKPLKRKLHSVSSTVGSIFNRDSDIKDETEVRPGHIASVVKVSERKSSVPSNLQANGNLIKKALIEATYSVAAKRKIKRKNDETDYVPTPIKKKLYVKPEDIKPTLESDEKDDNSISITEDSKVTSEELDEQNTPRFLITLNGIKCNTVLTNEDELLLDEEMEEEFQENDDSLINSNSDCRDDLIKERCKYWPSCKNGNHCLYHHPNTVCRSFPNCKFGDKCLFIHPDCKFGSLCTRKVCPFTHTSRTITSGVPMKASNIVMPCRYFPNCFNLDCPYQHPKPCNFGSMCRNYNCSFSHPLSSNKSLPKPSQFKWRNSERRFALNGKIEKMPVKIDKVPQ